MHAPNRDPDVMTHPKSEIRSVARFLNEVTLRIPAYQRPYKWTTKHVSDLFSDLIRHADRSAYRLGTVVIHREGDVLNLVDGQQRTLTLLLVLVAMIRRMRDEGGNTSPVSWRHRDLIQTLEGLDAAVTTLCGEFEFESDRSQENLKRNFDEIMATVSRPDFTDELALFFLNQCELVVFTLEEVSEAFQFFDSQNARGKDLDPHDLLKAYHLREFGSPREQGDLMTRTIELWEGLEGSQLAHFFESYWYRIRNWSRGKSARYFRKDDVGVFKGVNLVSGNRYPSNQILRVAHYFTDHHQSQYERYIDDVAQPFPFQFDQTILNGRRFFEMTSHYLELADRFTSDPELGRTREEKLPPCETLDGHAKEIVQVIDCYGGRHRRGDGYVRNLFDCLLLFYIDRFGLEKISRAIEKIFVWAYSVRLRYERIQLASVDNHALVEPSPFRVLRDASRPEEFLSIPLSPLGTPAKAVEELEALFRKMKYLK